MHLPPSDSGTPPGEALAPAMAILRYLGATGTALLALVLALQPDVGFVAPWPWMALFWLLQIAVGLAVLQGLLYALSRQRWAVRLPLWSLVLGSGVLGSALLAPLYWLIGEGLMETLLRFPRSAEEDGIPDPAEVFGLATLLQEFVDIVGQVTAAWVLISWPRLPGLLPPLLREAPSRAVPPPSGNKAPALDAAAGTTPRWRESLPHELGQDLIAVSSELQYLRVWTTRGSALVLGSLQEVEQQEGDAGLRLHRSWWVNARHVRRVRRRGESAVCTLSDGREVPVSRRRKAEALARFGDGASYEVAAAPASFPAGRSASEAATQTDLH